MCLHACVTYYNTHKSQCFTVLVPCRWLPLNIRKLQLLAVTFFQWVNILSKLVLVKYLQHRNKKGCWAKNCSFYLCKMNKPSKWCFIKSNIYVSRKVFLWWICGSLGTSDIKHNCSIPSAHIPGSGVVEVAI